MAKDLDVPFFATILMGALLGADSTRSAQPETSSASAEVSAFDFPLESMEGNSTSFRQLAAKPWVVVTFFQVGCPLVQKYAPRLNSLANRFADSAQFVGIDPHPGDTPQEIEDFAARYQVPFKLYRDVSGASVRALGAIRTPEVFLIDREGRVHYSGRIDDQFGIRGPLNFQRPSDVREDLALALVSVTTGQPVEIARTEPSGCLISEFAKPSGNAAPITWSNTIARIAQVSCQSCHRPGEVAPFSMMTYQDVVGWEAMILEVVERRRMPPWRAESSVLEFTNDCRLTEDEIQLFRQWVKSGAPEGDPADLPPPVSFPTDWRIGTPDLVIPMSTEPFHVPAEGVIEYQHFFIDPGFTEDKWIRAVECRPGNPSVVHHMTVFAVPPWDTPDVKNPRLLSYLIAGTNPGTPPIVLHDGAAIRVEKGTVFVFQMHYTTNGVAGTDLSRLGLQFFDPKEVRRQFQFVFMADINLEIPPHDPNYQVTSSITVSEDSELFCINPHMHLRGKSVALDALYPDKRSERLIYIPQYDFNWQEAYYVQGSKMLPAGTVLTTHAVFDNSANNPSNPNPNATVPWGDQTTDEMMVNTVGLLPLKIRPATTTLGGITLRPIGADVPLRSILVFLILLSALTVHFMSRRRRLLNQSHGMQNSRSAIGHDKGPIPDVSSNNIDDSP